jgi:Cytochrome c peroxidase
MKISRILGGIIVIAVVLFVVYKIMNTTPNENLPLNERTLAVLEDGGCLSCHSANPKLPFYANFPIAKDIVKQDVDLGYKFYDMEKVMADIKEGKAINIVDLTRIKRVLDNETMPPSKYYLVHWGSSITDSKAEIFNNYYNEQLAQMHKSFGALTAENNLTEPIIPLPDSIAVDMRKVVLGNILYHDGRLSKDNTVSCASCHELTTGGVDNKQFSEGVNKMLGGVNAPTVYNAYYNFVQFWDGRAADLALQAAGPPLNPIEMACESFDEIVAKLNEDVAIKTAFELVYPEGFSEATITDAIAEFEKTLITPNSKFDRYLKGDENAIDADEKQGYNLFKEYGCATCHSGINVGGQTYEFMGLFKDYFADRINDASTAAASILWVQMVLECL